MKRYISVLAVLCSMTLSAQEYLPHWQEGYFDIHEIATGEGDAHFMIFPDGTTMLCDAGDARGEMRVSDGSKKYFPSFPDTTMRSGECIAMYIKDFSKGLPHPEKVDYFWLTHFHSDHMGRNQVKLPSDKGYSLTGVTHVGEFISFGTIVDRDYPDYDYPSREAIHRASEGFLPDYMAFVEHQKARSGAVAEKFRIGTRKQFALRNAPEKYRRLFHVHNVASSGYITTGAGKRRMGGDDISLMDENMFSSVAVFRYGKFSYFQGGDITGSAYGTAYKGSQRNYESQIADVTGPVTVLSANHHGWKDTCNPDFLWKTQPKAITFSSSNNNHPREETVIRCSDPQYEPNPLLLVNTEAARERLGEELWSRFSAPAGHIVIRAYPGGETWQVFVLNSHSGKYEVIYKSEIMTL